MDASRVIPHLWQGSKLTSLPKGFDAVVFAAYEVQPNFGNPPKQLLIYAPMEDGNLEYSPHDRKMAEKAASRVAQLVQEGKRVLVTCNQGHNRSGLIVGLALRNLGMSTEKAIKLVRQARGPSALGNVSFVKYLETAR